MSPLQGSDVPVQYSQRLTLRNGQFAVLVVVQVRSSTHNAHLCRLTTLSVCEGSHSQHLLRDDCMAATGFCVEFVSHQGRSQV